MKVTDDGIHGEQIYLDKQDILDFFNEQTCSTCPFEKECNENERKFDSVSLCSLFGLI